MNTTLLKILREAWLMATGIRLTPLLRAEEKGIRTDIIKRALWRHFALQGLSHQHSPEFARFPHKDKRFRVHPPTLEEHWNY
jgi:hypothetical protein